MPNTVRLVLACAFLLAASAAGTPARHRPPAAAEDKSKPSYDLKAQAALDLADLQKKFTSLA